MAGSKANVPSLTPRCPLAFAGVPARERHVCSTTSADDACPGRRAACVDAAAGAGHGYAHPLAPHAAAGAFAPRAGGGTRPGPPGGGAARVAAGSRPPEARRAGSAAAIEVYTPVEYKATQGGQGAADVGRARRLSVDPLHLSPAAARCPPPCPPQEITRKIRKWQVGGHRHFRQRGTPCTRRCPPGAKPLHAPTLPLPGPPLDLTPQWLNFGFTMAQLIFSISIISIISSQLQVRPWDHQWRRWSSTVGLVPSSAWHPTPAHAPDPLGWRGWV
jgi:hypothetical protein